MRIAAVASLLLALALASAAAGQQSFIIGGAGMRGESGIGVGTCSYRVFVRTGILRVGVPQPAVSGADTRRDTRRERTWVRFRVWATDAHREYAPVAVTGWSSFIAVRQNEARTWSSATYFDLDWRGGYSAETRIEWWNSHRMIGWRAHRMGGFNFFDQYNVGPFGPISWCYKYTTY